MFVYHKSVNVRRRSPPVNFSVYAVNLLAVLLPAISLGQLNHVSGHRFKSL